MHRVFSASRVQHISDLHSKCELRPHHVWKYGRQLDIQSSTAEIRRGKEVETRMWANAQRHGRPGEYTWRHLFNAAVWLTPTSRVPCSNPAKTRNPLKFLRVPQTPEPISAVSGPKFTTVWGHVEEILPLNNFSDCRYVP